MSGERRFFRLKAGKRNLLAGSEEKIAGAREDFVLEGLWFGYPACWDSCVTLGWSMMKSETSFQRVNGVLWKRPSILDLFGDPMLNTMTNMYHRE